MVSISYSSLVLSSTFLNWQHVKLSVLTRKGWNFLSSSKIWGGNVGNCWSRSVSRNFCEWQLMGVQWDPWIAHLLVLNTRRPFVLRALSHLQWGCFSTVVSISLASSGLTNGRIAVVQSETSLQSCCLWYFGALVDILSTGVWWNSESS